MSSVGESDTEDSAEGDESRGSFGSKERTTTTSTSRTVTSTTSETTSGGTGWWTASTLTSEPERSSGSSSSSSSVESTSEGQDCTDEVAAEAVAGDDVVDPLDVSPTDRSALTEANVEQLYGSDEETRLQAMNSIRYHQSQGMSEDESVLLHLYRHSATSDPAFGVFLDDADELNSD